jgi:hypothetical protein
MNVRDWPQSIDGKEGLPLFSFSKRQGNQAADIMCARREATASRATPE